MFDDVEQHDHVHRAELREVRLIGDAGKHPQPGVPAMLGRILGELDAADVVETLGLLQEEAIGAADIEQPPGRLEPADEIDGAGKFPPENWFGAEIIGIAVVVTAGEIVCGVVALRVEIAGLGAAKSALRTAENATAVLVVKKLLERRRAARRTRQCPVSPAGGVTVLPLPRIRGGANSRQPSGGMAARRFGRVAAIHVPLKL